MKKFLSLLAALALFGSCSGTAWAALNFTVSASYPAEITMGSPTGTALTYTITNTSTSTTARINRLTFTAPTGFTWQGATLPTGWSIRSNSGNVFQIQTTNSIYNLNPVAGGLTPNAVTVTLALNAIPSLSADNVNGYLSSIQARYDKSSGGTRNKTLTNPPGTFPLVRGLLMTLVPAPTSVGTGGSFTLTMTVTNKSSVTQSGINSSPKPPLATGVSVTPGVNPPNISLAPGATNTLVWTYTAGGTAGTVSFTARASNGTVSSASVTSSVVTIGILGASISGPGCLISGATATFTMTVSNFSGSALTNLTPSVSTGGTATVGAWTGTGNTCPVPPLTLANGSSCQFSWSAPVTSGNIPASGAKPNFSLSGTVTGTKSPGPGTVTSPNATTGLLDLSGYAVDVTTTNSTALSAYAELSWVVVNRGCGLKIQSVSIPIPPAWTVSSDPMATYALTTNILGNLVETWAPASGTGPVVFSAPNATDQIPLNSSGNFYIVFSATPTVTGNSAFDVTVVNESGGSQSPQSTTVVVGPYNSSTGGPNYTNRKGWREDFK